MKSFENYSTTQNTNKLCKIANKRGRNRCEEYSNMMSLNKTKKTQKDRNPSV